MVRLYQSWPLLFIIIIGDDSDNEGWLVGAVVMKGDW